ncbi:MAG TPA: PA2779 family protein [Burkholderiales bacterium]|nr:PA2779 family protein [Burkholderiales bacterium]
MLIKRLIASVLIVSVAFLNVSRAAAAELVTTDAVAAAEAKRGAEADRAKVLAALERPDLQAKLQELGVSPAEAQKRVAALTDDEVSYLAGSIDQAPAGGVGVLDFVLIVFLVLLLTDILGYTHIFPFVKHGETK